MRGPRVVEPRAPREAVFVVEVDGRWVLRTLDARAAARRTETEALRVGDRRVRFAVDKCR